MKKILTIIGLIIGLGCIFAFKYFLATAPEKVIKKSQSFQVKARQSEAKLKLLSAYTAMLVEWTDTGVYSENSLQQVQSQPNDNYKVLMPSSDLSKQVCPSCFVSAEGFKIVAIGNIDKDDKFDIWTIDNKKNLVNVQSDAE